jgi:predicted ATP-grasp superfamily ATP-dependent carboligase
MYPPPFGNSTLMVSIELDEVRDAVQSLDTLLGSVGYRGIFSAEFKRDARDGLAKLIEVNIRPWWYVEFATRCGINVCALAALDALEQEVPPLSTYKVGKRCVFPYYDLSAIRRAQVEGTLGWWKGLRSWLGAYQPVFRWSDPLPALLGSFRLLGTRIARSVGRKS